MEKETEILTEIRPVTIPKKPKLKPKAKVKTNTAKAVFRCENFINIPPQTLDQNGRILQESEPVGFSLEKQSTVINVSRADVSIINSERFDSYNRLQAEQKIIVLNCFKLSRGECITLGAGEYNAVNIYGAYQADLFIC